ncbi:phage tail tube protein, partial [Erythrobacter sp. NE805]|uniref:phage tail tube protein n=1 Tax=Erythrobacter sp. NE805 TaxID=3389875 RepID=UPI00396B3653
GLLHTDGVSVAAMRAINNATLIFKGDMGKTWVVRGAYFVEHGDISQDGKVTVTFEGQPAEELV